MNDFKQLSEEQIEHLQQTAIDGRLCHALDTAWKIVRMNAHLAAQRRQGLNAVSLGMLEREQVKLDHLADYAMNAYRHSVECMPYTYDDKHRPFEHEGYNPDLNYRQIYAAYSALFHAAEDQAERIFDRLHTAWVADDCRMSWKEFTDQPEYREYQTIKECSRAFYRLMGFPGYWINWQLHRD